MPWSSNQNHNKESNNKMESPWNKTNQNSNKNNDFEDLLNFGKKKLNNIFHSKKNSNFFLIIIILLSGLYFLSGFYNVEQEEQAVVLRFGKFVRIATPGLNYHLPNPIEEIIKQKVTRAEKEEIGFRSSALIDNGINNRGSQRNVTEESLMLTGDENIVDINFSVQWKIRDIKDYIFNLYRNRETVKSVAESAMREVIGNTPIAVAQTAGRSDIERTVMNLIQNILDSYNSGIEIINLQMLKVDPPTEVVDAFRDVQTARADKEREINQAQTYHNDIIPRARGEASKIIQEAEGYKSQIVSIATGDASRFTAIYNEYKDAKKVTRKRLYIETMEEILASMDKIIIDKTIEKSVLPYLPISSEQKNN